MKPSIMAACGLAVCAGAWAQVNVEDSGVTASLADGVTSVSLAIENRLSSAVAARVELGWLGPEGNRVSTASAKHQATPGKSTVVLPLRLGDSGDALQLRLYYKVTPDFSNLAAFVPREGMLSFPHIARHAFRITGFGLGRPFASRPWEVRVLALHPISGKPMPGVTLEAEKRRTVTDANGLAAFRFDVNPEMWDQSASIEVRGVLGDLEQEFTLSRPELPRPVIRIDTDKPIYQPGQTLHVRALVTGGGRKRDGEYAIRVHDGSGGLVHQSTSKLSRFGVTHADWLIPANAEAGTYRIEVEHEQSGLEARRDVTVKRYELPSFRVTTKLDRGYYLRGQRASVEVHADYLFGKPVAQGKVLVTKGEDSDDDAVAEGVLDGGVFRFHMNLDDEVDVLDRLQFRDLTYTASVTDASTNRTEQRRFQVRVSRQAVHIYVSRGSSGIFLPPLFVTAYSPDGAPLSTEVELLQEGKRLATARTNRFGVARFQAPAVDGKLVVRTNGAQETIEAPDRRGLRLDTDKSLYRAGEPVVCTIVSARRDLQVVLLAWGDSGRVVFSTSLRLDRKASVTIPYDARAGRELHVGVVSEDAAEYQAVRSVIYPGAPEFRVSAKPAHDTYRPGEKGSIALRAMSGGTPVEAALGIAIVDQSVFERASADESLRPRRWFDIGWSTERRVSGWSRSDLLEMDPSKIDADLQLVAEAVLEPRAFFDVTSSGGSDQFAKSAAKDLKAIRDRLDDHYHRTLEYPRDEAALSRIAGSQALPPDPWLLPYRVEFETRHAEHVVRFVSPGPDKRAGTGDDITVLEVVRQWFLPFQWRIQDTLHKLDDMPATEREFAKAIAKAGLRWETILDPWDRPLRVLITHNHTRRHIEVRSDGPDGRAGTDDDFPVARFSGTYFRSAQKKIEEVLAKEVQFPQDAPAFRKALAAGGVGFESLRDPWSKPYWVIARTESHFANYVLSSAYSEYGGIPELRREVKPTTVRQAVVEIRSSGQDGVLGTYDDFTIADFSRAVAEKAPDKPEIPEAPKAGGVSGTGSIVGTITDASGAVIPNVEVIFDGRYRMRSNSEGLYRFAGVPAGLYTLQFESPGFRRSTIAKIPVTAGTATRVDVRLEVGEISETVMVSAQVAMLQTDTAMASSQSVVTNISTPRLREHFPETLLWQPEMITGADGRASLDVKLADNITTWHVAVIASTADGRVTEASTEIRAFQPFFADLDPPQVLTVGDRIDLPVPIRNYLTTGQTVAVEASAPAAISLSSGARGSVKIAASGAANHVVSLRAAAASSGAPLRITARAKSESDAIEKKIAIHPDGMPVSRSAADLLIASRSLGVDVPPGIVPGTLSGQVKVYPSLLAHVLEAMESLLHMPTGCGEQTISSAYPSLLFLRALKRTGVQNKNARDRAQAFLEAGYARLLGYRDPDGGFRYWPTGGADIALTAYALRFLEDAAEFIAVDDGIAAETRKWLTKSRSLKAHPGRHFHFARCSGARARIRCSTASPSLLAKLWSPATPTPSRRSLSPQSRPASSTWRGPPSSACVPCRKTRKERRSGIMPSIRRFMAGEGRRRSRPRRWWWRRSASGARNRAKTAHFAN